MDSNGIPPLSSGVNYEEVDPLSQKRIITFFNEFVCQTVTFLNKFSAECEEKLLKVDTRLEKLETILAILEAKLSSVPGLAKSQTVPSQSSAATSEEAQKPTEAAPPSGGDQSAAPQPDGDQSAAGLVCLRQTEPYRRFFRMLEVGVPEPAVRLKMQQEGVDPDALHRGGELVPPNAAAGRRGSETGSTGWSSRSVGSDSS